MANLGIIKDLMKERGISTTDMCNYLNITQQGFLKIIRENSTRIETLEAIANKLKVSINVFFENTEKESDKEVEILHNSKLYERKEGRHIKLYPFEASANLKTIFMDSNEATETIYIPNAPECDAAVYVLGDSMYPVLNSGDIVAYKNIYNIDHIQYNQIYLVNFVRDDEYYLAIKYIKRSEKKGYVKLVSENKIHEPLDIPISSIRNLAIIKLSIKQNNHY